MKKVFVLVVLMVLYSSLVYAAPATGYTANASPVIVSLSGSGTSASKEITFPYSTRNLYIKNYDTNGGIWVNLRGNDVNALDYTGNRIFIASGKELDLFDFVTGGITIFNDIIITSNATASPISVLATY